MYTGCREKRWISKIYKSNFFFNLFKDSSIVGEKTRIRELIKEEVFFFYFGWF